MIIVRETESIIRKYGFKYTLLDSATGKAIAYFVEYDHALIAAKAINEPFVLSSNAPD